ncbi:MAG: hypothetical protein R3F49_23685 [Planctomycetota bacterium]
MHDPSDDSLGRQGWDPVEDQDAFAGLSAEQYSLQHQLSCLVDGELDEPAAAQVMVLLEESADAREFFDDIRAYARLHRDIQDPARLEARMAMFSAALFRAEDVANAAESIDLAHRLATIFYQLGKAYTLNAIEPEAFQQRVFERAVPIEETRAAGRGFVDDVVAGGRDPHATIGAALDWRTARSLFNGRLERIADPLEKGRRLLEQAVETDPSHEEARIYLAFVHAREGRSIRAAEGYREVFDSAMERTNRGHAAMQLGRLFYLEGDTRSATCWWRWLTISGLADADPRFEGARLNLGVVYATVGDLSRSVDYFRALLDQHMRHHDGDVSGVARLFAGHRDLRELIESRPGLTEQLVARCPELFRPSAAGGAA